MLNNPLLTLKNTLNTVHKINFLTMCSSMMQTTRLYNGNVHTVISYDIYYPFILPFSVSDQFHVQNAVRGPEKGCPWY